MNQTAESVLRKISRMRCAHPAKGEPCGRCPTCIAREFFKEYDAQRRREGYRKETRGGAGALGGVHRPGRSDPQAGARQREEVEKRLVWHLPVGTKVEAAEEIRLYMTKPIKAGTRGRVCKLGPRLRPHAEFYMTGKNPSVPVKFPGAPSFWATLSEIVISA